MMIMIAMTMSMVMTMIVMIVVMIVMIFVMIMMMLVVTSKRSIYQLLFPMYLLTQIIWLQLVTVLP